MLISPMLHRLLLAASLTLLLNALTVAQTSKATARKFDEFGDILASDLIARLDNLAVALANEPNTKTFLVVYRTKRDLPGLSNRYAHRMKSYLIGARGVPAERVVIIDGGIASCLSQELWIVPPGTAPKPRDDAFDNSYKPDVYKFDEHFYHLGNDPLDESYWPVAPQNLIGYLESFGETLLKDRKLVAYLVAFRDVRRDKQHPAQLMLSTERKFLIKEFRIKPSRIRTIVGGYREWRTMELWLAQPGYRPIITSYRVGRVRRKR
jgi:hypothetical protein